MQPLGGEHSRVLDTDFLTIRGHVGASRIYPSYGILLYFFYSVILFWFVFTFVLGSLLVITFLLPLARQAKFLSKPRKRSEINLSVVKQTSLPLMPKLEKLKRSGKMIIRDCEEIKRRISELFLGLKWVRLLYDSLLTPKRK